MRVLIPTIKKIEHSKGVVYDGVFHVATAFYKEVPYDIKKVFELFRPVGEINKPLKEVMEKYGLVKDDLSNADKISCPCVVHYAVEIIAERNFRGKNLDFLKSKAIAKISSGYVLSIEDGAKFLNMIKK